MPPRNKPKDSKTYKQRTLFELPSSPTQHQPSPSKKTKRTRVQVTTDSPSKKRSVASDSDDEISAIKLAPATTAILNQTSSEDEDAVRIVHISRKRRKVRISSASASENELQSPVTNNHPSSEYNLSEDLDNPAASKRGRLQRRKSSDQQSSNEDVAQLVDEVDEERILDSRFRTRNKSAFQKNLEKLKRRKLKLEDEEEEDDEEEEEEEESPAKPFKSSRPSSQHLDVSDDEHSNSSNSSDFIVEDDGSVQLPAEFSMETHQDLSHQFKKIFQFFVHVAVQPPKSRASFMEARIRDEEYFSVPLQVTRRKLSGLRDSLVSSSVWRPEFKKSLERYPDFELVALDFAVPSCDACHLGGRVSTLLGRLSGSQYNKFGFKAKTPPKSEEREGKEFHLGRFCARRTRVFHEFSHWEHYLFHTILREIDGLRNAKSSKDFHPIAFFGGKQPPEDLQDADGLCDWLDERRIVDMEWQKMKKMMESARHLELGDKRGETDDY